MIRSLIRVSILLERDADKDDIMAELDRVLGRVPELVWRFRDLPVLVARLYPDELERLRQIPGVRSAEPERQTHLPIRPDHPVTEK